MKLPLPSLDLVTQLAEFDVWLTPSLGEIRDTERFQRELRNVADIVDALGRSNADFENEDTCKPNHLADTFVELIANRNRKETQQLLESLSSVLFLVTGKSDNNSKCQLPIYLLNQGWSGLPSLKSPPRTNPNVPALVEIPMPRVMKASSFMDLVSKLSDYPDVQKRLLRAFVGFILSDDEYVTQLWAIGKSYSALKELGKERALLTPLVIFQVRGSVTASGGHGPEEQLRTRLKEWGLLPAIDFNLADVVPVRKDSTTESSREDSGKHEKKRGFDFIFPYRSEGWEPTIFVQSQFYAGDSGSVSHKVVDQTKTSRNHIQGTYPLAKFVEYVDGAGYFSSLNGDLRKILYMPSTASFFQIRSAPIRLRQQLQAIGFLTLLEIEHALLRSNHSPDQAKLLLANDGYSQHEIDRVWTQCLRHSSIEMKDQTVAEVRQDRRDLVRRYFILDVAAIFGQAPEANKLAGHFFVPGYGPFYGVKLSELPKFALGLAPSLKNDWIDPSVLLSDIAWLCEMGWAMAR